MTALRNTQLDEEFSPDLAFWRTLLRTACHTVTSQPTAMITATTVSHRFPDITAWETRVLTAAAWADGDKTGLVVETEDEGDRLTVRFSRRLPERMREQAGSSSSRRVIALGAVWRR